jgi:hypothetical protein
LVVFVFDESRNPDDPPVAEGSNQSDDVIDADEVSVPKIDAATDETDGTDETDDMRDLDGPIISRHS